MRPPPGHLLGHHEVRRSGGGHGRQVGDAQHLMIVSQRPHFRAHGMGDLTPDVGVDFVEDEQRDGVLSGEGRFDREHQP